jgi:hypothetical protein
MHSGKVEAKMRGKLYTALSIVALLLVAPNGAQALTLNVVGGAVGIAQLCADPTCTTETLAFDDGGAATGTITVDGGNVSFDVTVSVIGFSGGPDGAVSDLELQTVHYVSGPVAYAGTASDFNAGGTAAVTGTVSPNVGASSALNIPAAPFVIDCEELAGQLTCGLVLAGFPIFSVPVDGNPRYVPHTVNLIAVPEPQLSVMALTAGLMGLAYGRRKATN